MKLKALVTAELNIDVLREMVSGIEFDAAGYCVNHEILSSTEMEDIISDYDILISEFETITENVLAAAPNLKLIICCRGGVKSVIDIEAAHKRNIMVSHNAGRNAYSVSEMVMGYILDLNRNITVSSNLIHNRVITSNVRNIPSEYKDSIWGLNSDSPYVKLRGRSLKTMSLGIVGFGNVGRQVAEKASVFGMEILIYDPIEATMAISDNVKRLPFEDLIATADIVSLHCPPTSSNQKMMGYEQFKSMKKTAFFINTARGSLVDEEALAWALKTGEIAGAAIDVTSVEPLPDNHLLLDVPNLIITPHIAGASDDVIKKGTEMVVHKLISFLGMDLVM